MGAKISVYPSPRMDRVDKSGRVQVRLRIDLDSKPVAYDSKNTFKIPADSWDADKKVVKPSYQAAKQINIALANRRVELEKEFISQELAGLKLNAQRIKQLVSGENPGRCFYTFCRKQISDKYENDETRRTYESEITKLESFRPNLTFNDIDFTFLQEYAAWMRDVRENSPNTIWKAFKFMHTMFEDAIKAKGIVSENPFDTFDRGQYKQTKRTWLDKGERLALEKLLYTEIGEELYKVVVYMLFMCYCGLRFEDAMIFNYDEHIVDDERLMMETGKEDESLNIKLYPKLREIVMWVRDHPLQTSNQEFNRWAKIAAAAAGIKKNLTAHVGRHTFGRILAENKVNEKKAQRLLAHRDPRSTRIYYHLLDTDVDDEVDERLSKL